MSCDLCGSKSYLQLPQYPAASICAICGFIYVRERRSAAEIARAWDDVWGAGYSSEWPAVRARLTYVAEYLDQIFGLGGKSICDIGAGEGTFLQIAREQYGALVFGIEPDASNCRLLSSKDISYFHGTAEEYDIAKPVFDVVTLLWTLENTGDCIAVLKKAKDMLHPGGHICVATGSRILVPFKKPLTSYFGSNPPDLHCFRWSQNSLARALIETGFGPPTFNDFVENDALVAVAQPSEPPPKCFEPKTDDPKEILEFFRKWEECFP